MNPVELRRKGYAALVDALGFVGMVRFMRQFDLGSGDYTKERSQWLDKVSLEEILADIDWRQKKEALGSDDNS